MKPLHIAAATIAAIAVVALLAPTETKTSIHEAWLRVTGDPGFACFEHERATLNDPISAKLQRHVVISETTGEVAIAVLAKNPFGAYLPVEASCIIKDGKVDIAATDALRARERLTRAQDRRIESLKARAECLQAKSAAIREGKTPSPLPCPGE